MSGEGALPLPPAMITLRGTYADDCNGPLPDRILQYVCRAFEYKGVYYNGIGEVLEVKDDDVLLVCGKGTWFALYKEYKENELNN